MILDAFYLKLKCDFERQIVGLVAFLDLDQSQNFSFVIFKSCLRLYSYQLVQLIWFIDIKESSDINNSLAQLTLTSKTILFISNCSGFLDSCHEIQSCLLVSRLKKLGLQAFLSLYHKQRGDMVQRENLMVNLGWLGEKLTICYSQFSIEVYNRYI